MNLFPNAPKPLRKSYAAIKDVAAWVAYANALRAAAEANIAELSAELDAARTEVENLTLQLAGVQTPEPDVTTNAAVESLNGTIVRRGVSRAIVTADGASWTLDANLNNGAVLHDGELFGGYSGSVASIEKISALVIRQTHDDGRQWDAIGGGWVLVTGATSPAQSASPSSDPSPPPSVSDPRRNGGFWFYAFSGVLDGMEEERESIRRAKAMHQSFFIGHADRYAQGPADMDNNRRRYNDRMQAMLDAALAEGDFKIVPCFHGNWPDPVDKEVLRTFLNQFLGHPAVLREKGVPVIACYDYHWDFDLVQWAWANGFPRGTWRLWAFVEPWDDNGWSAAHGGEGKRIWHGCEEFLHAHDEIDGMWNYAANYGAANGSAEAQLRALLRNRNLVTACKATGRTSIAGWSGRYYSNDFSLEQLAEQHENVIALGADHYLAVAVNDLKEGQTGKVGRDFDTAGGAYIPPRNSGWTHGLPLPIPDLTRFANAAVPHVQRFLSLPR